MNHTTAAVLVAGLALCLSAPVAASAPDFGYVYTADSAEPGETEVSIWATDRRGKSAGHYDAQDYKLEVERGLSDRFQISAYASFAGHHVRGLGGEFVPVDRDFAFQGLSAEFKYQLIEPSKDGFGLAFYVEPGWSRISKVKGTKTSEYEFELKAIVQKNFLADHLVWASNLTFEPEWEREREEVATGLVTHKTEQELSIEVASGLSYQVAPRWWVGAEGRYHSVYPDWTHGLHRENYAVYAGPSVHYDAGRWAVTATWQPQLFGSPSGPGSSLELDDHE